MKKSNYIKDNINSFDLSNLNFIEAIKCAVEISTNCFIQNENNKVRFILKDEIARKLMLPFKLKNTILEIKDKENYEKHYQANYR